jgi:hypothetical protein
MAAAGYDPREMASMFETIEEQSGSGGPQWLSGHPDPGDRSASITREAALLTVRDPVRDVQAFTKAQARLRQMATAPTTEEATRTMAGRGTVPVAEGPLDPGRVAPPSSTYTVYTEGDVFRVSVPENWRELPGNAAVLFAPDGAYGTAGERGIFTHGMEIGVARNETHDLRTAIDEFVASLARSNPNLRDDSDYSRVTMGGRRGLHTTLSNRSPATNQDERIGVFAILLDDGNLFYALGVAPRDRFPEYEATFRKIIGSIALGR